MRQIILFFSLQLAPALVLAQRRRLLADHCMKVGLGSIAGGKKEQEGKLRGGKGELKENYSHPDISSGNWSHRYSSTDTPLHY